MKVKSPHISMPSKRWLVLSLSACVAIALAGPRIKVDTRIQSFNLPEDLDGYLKARESRYPDITPGTEKKIFWHQQQKDIRPYALVYLHGFSATRQEISPLPEQVAETLGAHLFATRFTGHGRSGEAMAEASVNAWLNDGAEALEIGRRLGRKTIVIAVSTGATAALYLAKQARFREQIAAVVLLSPNLGLPDPKAGILSWPWGQQVAEGILGPERSWQPRNAAEARYWTHRYPTRALLPMIGLVELTRSQDFRTYRIPTLMVYSPNDQVISVPKMQTVFKQMAAQPKELMAFTQSADSEQHILAGDILSPQSTSPLKHLILEFLQKQVLSP